MTFSVTRDDGLTISDDSTRLDLDRICAWLATSYWAPDRNRATIERSIAGSSAYGAYDADGGQIAFARVVTDWATFAWIADVIVDDAWRGRGVGSWFVGGIVSQLTDAGLGRLVLATRDAHEVYARLGFEPLRFPSTWMEIDRRPHRLEPSEAVTSG